MLKKIFLAISFICYALAFLLNFVWIYYPYNWVFGVAGVIATLTSFWVRE